MSFLIKDTILEKFLRFLESRGVRGIRENRGNRGFPFVIARANRLVAISFIVFLGKEMTNKYKIPLIFNYQLSIVNFMCIFAPEK